MSIENYVLQNREYIKAKITHFDSNIRMITMSEFDRLAMIELKEFLEGLLQRVPDQYINPTFTE
jgi:hypothetical protein